MSTFVISKLSEDAKGDNNKAGRDKEVPKYECKHLLVGIEMNCRVLGFRTFLRGIEAASIKHGL